MRHPEEEVRRSRSKGLKRLLWAFASKWSTRRVISFDDSPYLLRLYLTPDWLPRVLPRLYLHYFFRSDGDCELHNHPWKKSVSFILSGGYEEVRRKGNDVITREVKPWSFNRIAGNDFHRVKLYEEGCWSLFMTWNRVQRWGFWNVETGTYTDWEQFTNSRL